MQSLHTNHMQMSIVEVFICRRLHMNTSMIPVCIWLICRLCTALHTKCCGAVICTHKHLFTTLIGYIKHTRTHNQINVQFINILLEYLGIEVDQGLIKCWLYQDKLRRPYIDGFGELLKGGKPPCKDMLPTNYTHHS